MKNCEWSITIGEAHIPISSDEEIDALEACTRAIDYLHLNKHDYIIGPFIAAESGGRSGLVRSDIALANAGRHQQCEKLRTLIKEYNKTKNKTKH